ncbi:hypothetical protein T484DRAFT_1823302 [Baffinella frigidus]|nr:hypothetical protein T484DRAFT_1823302 [Cryptophyta sp. CCMP2293]
MSVLAAQFAHSLHEGNKHRHVETEKLSDKFFHDAKRLRAERNTYITFGAMFMFLVLCQLWVIIKRTLQLEEQIEKKDLVFAAFKKQVENREEHRDTIPTVENREEHRDTIPTAGAGSDEAAALREEVHNLKKQIERLEREAGDAPSAPPEEPSMRKRAGNSNTDKDE